ncbi:MAG: nicotinate-nucleotide--dimethylbenzimidazole phosphoribosyltransferase [Halochromatium sp.]|uniref:nicotinate-nucleotide--dimethylbenzimidazole phosphoribosyltransferase n=1 Tax=Halochromatium sp. TaxID=2049430 RepID=UPI00397B8A81
MRIRLLDMVADHGTALAVNGAGRRGQSMGAGEPESSQCPRSHGLGARRCQAPGALARLAVVTGAGAFGALVTEIKLDLGRQDAARIDPGAQRFDLGPGTLDSRLGAAMDSHRLDRALSAGRQAIERAKLEGVAAISARGGGTGARITNRAWYRLLNAGDLVEREDTDVALILKRHAAALDRADPYRALRCLGGFEHAALVGSALAAAQLGLPWWAVGASARIAVLLALRLNPSARPWLHVPSVGCGEVSLVRLDARL